MLLTANSLVLPAVPSTTWVFFSTFALMAFLVALIMLLMWISEGKRKRKKNQAVRIYALVALLLSGAIVAVLDIPHIVTAVNYPKEVQSSAEKWINQRYEQHFTAPQVDQLVHPLAYPKAYTSDPNTPFVRYGSTDLIEGRKIIRVQLVKVNGGYKILGGNRQSLADELQTK